MKKGQSEIIENFFTILFGVILFGAVSIMLYNIYLNHLKAEIENNLRQIGGSVSNNILKLYEVGKRSKVLPEINKVVKLAEVDLKLPTQVSGRNYEIYLIASNPIWVQISSISVGGLPALSSVISPSGVKIILRTTQHPIVEVEEELPNVDVFVQGKVESGLESLLKYYRYNSQGSVKDIIVLGGEDIIIDVEKVS